MRDGEETSADWDQEKLEDVIDKKHGKEKSKPTTEIVSCFNTLLLFCVLESICCKYINFSLPRDKCKHFYMCAWRLTN